MIGCVCKYTPIELLLAFGAECEILNGMPEGVETAEQMTGAGICGFGKAVIEEVVGRGIRELVLVDCCDTIRSVADVLGAGVAAGIGAAGRSETDDMAGGYGMDFVFEMAMPRCDGECARRLLSEELERLAREYGEFSGREFDEELFRRAFSPAPADPPVHVAVMGARIGRELLEEIRAAMPVPVVDRTCIGNREAGYGPVPKDIHGLDELLDWYAGELFGQLPCMRMADATGRRRLLDDPGLVGIIYHTVSFCDFYSLEYPEIREGSGVPCVKIESDFTLQGTGQLATRIEAFAETLPLDAVERTRSAPGGAAWASDTTALGASGRAATSPRTAEGRYFAGIDSGSTSTGVVILDSASNVVSRAIVPTGAGATASAESALAEAIRLAGISPEDLTATVATGYGRATVGADGESVTEISCHARGARFLDPAVRTVIDIGGQDSKAILMDEFGRVVNFAMNDKCAAGTGRFLENMAKALEMDLSEMAGRGLDCRERITISSTCAVFAESEVISLIAQDRDVDDIVHGLNESVAGRTVALVRRVGGRGRYMMTGGVARNSGVVRAIEEKLGEPLEISEDAQLCGALGAALYAMDSVAAR